MNSHTRPTVVPLHGAAQHRLQQGSGLLLPERPHLQPFEVAVLPQAGDEVRYRLAGTYGGHHHHRGLYDELVHQERRHLVQQVGVVDPEDHLTVARIRPEGANGFGHEHGGVTAQATE